MKDPIKLDIDNITSTAKLSMLEDVKREALDADRLLLDRKGPGREWLGWLKLPRLMRDGASARIKSVAEDLSDSADVLVVLGIGGSYLGARSAIEFLAPQSVGRNVFFTGYDLSGRALGRLLDSLDGKRVAVNVISKSGTTLETAVAFRVVEEHLHKRYGSKEMKERVVCTTGPGEGALRRIAQKRSYRTLDIPPDVGGRYSVLTAVGLLPMAWCGLDIDLMLEGASDQIERSGTDESSGCVTYAALRKLLYDNGKAIEILSSFDPDLHYIGEWWRQLFGESEGKDGKGIFPSCCDFTTDLHSMGQWIQQGVRNIFETFLTVGGDLSGTVIPEREEDDDGLNYISGRDMDFTVRKAYEATASAHAEGGVPNMTFELAERSEYVLGAFFYFLQRSAAISGYLLGVNPFDQPGVESYKSKMLTLLQGD